MFTNHSLKLNLTSSENKPIMTNWGVPGESII